MTAAGAARNKLSAFTTPITSRPPGRLVSVGALDGPESRELGGRRRSCLGRAVLIEPVQILGEGILVGFAVAAPVGPVAVVSIERTLHHGLAAGLAVGLGAALADTVLGAFAGFGLTFITEVIHENRDWLRLVGGIVLIALGIVLIASRAKTKRRPITAADLLHAFISSFAITISNPITIFAFLAIFAGLGFTETASTPGRAALLVGGIFLGAVLWWTSLSAMVAWQRHRVSERTLAQVKGASGYLILGFGIYALVSLGF